MLLLLIIWATRKVERKKNVGKPLRDRNLFTCWGSDEPVNHRARKLALNESLAQLVEQGIFNPKVVGSSPTRPI